MFCSVTESVNKEVEVETVGETAQLAQPVHLGAPSSTISHISVFSLSLLSLSHRQLLKVGHL